MEVYLQQFILWMIETNRSPATQLAYSMDISQFATWFETENGEKFQPGLLNGPDLRAYARMMKATNRAATWNRKRSALRVFCSWALLAGHLHYDPFEDVPDATPDVLPTRWLTVPEYHRLLRTTEQLVNAVQTTDRIAEMVRNQAIVALAVFSGLREAEIVALQMSDISLGERSCRIVVRLGKGQKRREVPMASDGRRSLRLWIKIRGEDPGPFIGVGTRQIQRIVNDIGQAAKIETLTPHVLRHTFAKNLVRSGVDIATIAMLLGHSRIETTKRYIQPGWEDLENAIEAL